MKEHMFTKAGSSQFCKITYLLKLLILLLDNFEKKYLEDLPSTRRRRPSHQDVTSQEMGLMDL